MTWTIEQCAHHLGITESNYEAFAVVADLMRYEEKRTEEQLRIAESLAKVNQTLWDAGFQYPLGHQGVKDMAMAYEGVREELKAMEEALKGVDAVKVELKTAKDQLASIDKTLKDLGIDKQGAPGVWRLAVMYEDARDKQAEEDLKRLKDDLDRQLAKVGTKEAGTRGLRELVDRLERYVAELEGIDADLKERGYTSKGLAGVRQLARHDAILTENAVETNAVLERVSGIRCRGSAGVRELAAKYRVLAQWTRDHADDQVEIPPEAATAVQDMIEGFRAEGIIAPPPEGEQA